MTEEIIRLIETLKQKMREDICAKYPNCKGCPVRSALKVDLCDFVYLFEHVVAKDKENKI